MESQRLDTRLGPLAWRSSGSGPVLVFFPGALANHDLWRDVVGALEDRYRCITIDLPLGAHAWPLSRGADRSAGSVAALLLDCLELLDLDDATLIANDTAGGLLLLALAGGHRGLARVGRLVLTNCESYEKFPPRQLRLATTMCRTVPRLAQTLMRLSFRSPMGRRGLAKVTAKGLDDERAQSFLGPARHEPGVVADYVALAGTFRPQLLIDAAAAIPRFDRPVLLVWGDACEFFPITDAERLASEFPHATLVRVPGAKTWVPIDDPGVVAGAITQFA